MATFFEKNKKNFQDVTIVEGKVDTSQFLDASKDLVGLFGECSEL
jgi:5S rRNA maturation endonuclease (ribonuclease M5)